MRPVHARFCLIADTFEPYFAPVNRVLSGTATKNFIAKTVNFLEYHRALQVKHFTRGLYDHFIEAVSHPVPAFVFAQSEVK
jgi:hypothetical protein